VYSIALRPPAFIAETHGRIELLTYNANPASNLIACRCIDVTSARDQCERGCMRPSTHQRATRGSLEDAAGRGHARVISELHGGAMGLKPVRLQQRICFIEPA